MKTSKKSKEKDEPPATEVTPNNIRLRKMELDQNKRITMKRKEKYSSE